MTLVLVLLVVIVVLLLVIIAMLVTGWPGRQREEMERVGNGLRREMAEHRAESIRMMNAIRITVEDSIQESVEREMAAARPRRSRKSAKAAQVEVTEIAAAVAAEEPPESVLDTRQISLFDEAASAKPEPVESKLVAFTASPMPVIGGDDLPDVE